MIISNIRSLALTLAVAATSIESCSCFTAHHFVPITTSIKSSTLLFAKENVLKEGRLVEYTSGTGSNKQITLGAIIGKDGKTNLKILTSSGRTSSVPLRSIKHMVPNAREISSEHQIEQHEIAAADALEKDGAAGGQSVAEVWEMLLDEEPFVDLQTLSELILGDSTSISCYATRAVLTEGVEKFCFKEINGGNKDFDSVGPMYEPRPMEVVEAMRSRGMVEAREAAKWEVLKQRINDANSSGEFVVQNETEELQTALKSLERLGCMANLSPDKMKLEEKAMLGNKNDADELAIAKQFLQNIDRKGTPEVARQLLTSLGIWTKHSNLDLVRLKVRTAFDSHLNDAADDIASNPPLDLDEHSRLDLTHLPAFAIDEASTKEIDDAVSVEILGTDGPIHSRLRLWIHIADPTRYIELGSPLGQEARRRATTIYLPTETIPMFPMTLAAGPLSLRPGVKSCALSIGIMLDEYGGIDEATPPIITPSYVKTTRLTYDQVDCLLDPFAMAENERDDNCDSELNDIDDIETTIECLNQLKYASEQRLRWRVDGGSLESISPYELPDMNVKATPSVDGIDGWQVDIYAKEQKAANSIVTELMLAANEAVALYGDKHGVPMPFRSQGMDELSDEEIEMTPEGACRSWLAILSTRRSEISSTPMPHAGLGLDMYVQVTSPVRRYADLALHFQIKSHLRGDPLPFPGNGSTEETMVGIAQNAGTISRQLERPANDYWLKEFLRRRGSQITQALVLSSDRWKDNVYKLLLPELGAICTYSSTTPLAVGVRLEMKSMHLAELL